MLELLKVHNIAIVEHATLELGEGFTTITGETGSGKSVLMGALKLALGDRANVEVLRDGAKKASVEAYFTFVSSNVLAWIRNQNLAWDDDQELVPTVVLRREINSVGQSRAFINNHPVSLTQLRTLASQLIDIHGQYDSAALFSQSHQMKLLDGFGNYLTEINDFENVRCQYHEVLQKLRFLEDDAESIERKRSYLEFQIREIDEAMLEDGEEEKWEVEKKRLQNAEQILNVSGSVVEILYEGERLESPALSLLSIAEKHLSDLVRLDDSTVELLEKVQEIRFSAEDLVSQVRSYLETISADPVRLEFVTNRIDMIKSLKKKYGSSVAQILQYRDECALELSELQNRDDQLEKLRSEIVPLEKALTIASQNLSKSRIQAAGRYSELVTEEMRQLNLPQSVFFVDIHPREYALPELPEHGADECEFMVQMNIGESAKPLRKVASGGEVSRIMLAIKGVIASKDEVRTLVFDEIDSGISGDAAGKVGEKLALLGQMRQVIAITHLPQIAVRGGTHLVVEKIEKQDRTHVSILRHEGKQRAKTIASMIVGHPPDQETIQYAETLLARIGDNAQEL